MSPPCPSRLLTDLTSGEVRQEVERDPRLLMAIGACDSYGPHLPLGAVTCVAEAFAIGLSRECGILRAPTLPYGVNTRMEQTVPGSAGMREKTLHTCLNDLLTEWEAHGFGEFILLTAHPDEAHLEAIASVTVREARIRVIDLLEIDCSPVLGGPPLPERGGEILTSLMLHLAPELVRMEWAIDYLPPERHTRHSSPATLPAIAMGTLGRPTLASAQKGRRLYEYIHEKIRTALGAEPL